jgi:hypothetical protein
MTPIRLASGLAVIAFLVAAAVGAAAPGAKIRSTHNTFTCTWTAAEGGSVSCQRVGKRGLTTHVSQKRVLVRERSGRIVKSLAHPSSGPIPPIDVKKRTFKETHNKVTCTWAADNGGLVACSKANRSGLIAANTPLAVFIADASGKVVFQRAQS